MTGVVQTLADAATKQNSEASPDTTLSKLTIEGKKIDARLEEACIDATIERSIEGASTLTITLFDPNRNFLNSGIFNARVGVTIDRYKFRLVQISRQYPNIQLTFEEDAVSRLRAHTKALKVDRNSFTRAEFIAMMVREEPDIRFYCPELHDKQPILTPGSEYSKAKGTFGQVYKKKRKAKHKKAVREPGFSPASLGKIKIAGGAADSSQLDIMERVLLVGHKMGASRPVLIASVAAGNQESGMKNLDNAHSDSTSNTDTSAGVFQIQKHYHPEVDNLDVEDSAKWFYTSAMKRYAANPGINIGDLAFETEGAAAEYRYRYRAWVPEATYAVDHFFGGTADNAVVARKILKTEKYEFTRGLSGAPEDTWTCIQRLAGEVNWRAFMVGNILYYCSEAFLMQSRPRMSVNEGTTGVDQVNFDWDGHKQDATAEIICRASRWFAPPGSVIELDESGPANGRWLVHGITRSLFNQQTTIDLKRSLPILEEPAPSTYTQSVAPKKTFASGSKAGVAAANWALQWDPTKTWKGGPAYVLGAKHGISLDTILKSKQEPPFDCSSFARIAWAIGGQFDIAAGCANDATQGLIAGWKARANVPARGGTLMGDDGKEPQGGFQPGDVVFPHSGHVALALGNSRVISAHSAALGISAGEMYQKVYFWFRPVPGPVIPGTYDFNDPTESDQEFAAGSVDKAVDNANDFIEKYSDSYDLQPGFKEPEDW